MKDYSGVESLKASFQLIHDALDKKQDTLTGAPGQIVGFNAAGKPVPQDVAESTGGVESFNRRKGDVVPEAGDYTPDMVGAAPTTHDHDDRYHKKAEVESLLAEKSDKNHSHTLEELGAAGADHSHTAEEVGAASKTHTHTPEEIGAAAADHTHDLSAMGVAGAEHTHGNATQTTPGFMSAADKTKLDNITNVDEGSHIPASTTTPKNLGSVASVGTEEAYARGDHVHQMPTATQIGAASAVHTHDPTDIGAATADHTHTPAEIGAAPTSHNHDDRYYTEGEVDTKLAGKSNTTHTHPVATTSDAGLMSAADKAKLDKYPNSYTAVNPSSTTPKVAGTAAVGSETSFARGDHVHPAQTSVSGNAGTATKLATPRYIDGVPFDGSGDIVHYGRCESAADEQHKVVDCPGFKLMNGARITVLFMNGNTAGNGAGSAPDYEGSLTLNVNGTGPHPLYMDTHNIIYTSGSVWPAFTTEEGCLVDFIYSGECWLMPSGPLRWRVHESLKKDETAAAATKLATSRNIQVNLASTSAAGFNGTSNCTPGVTGVLGTANGGTGSTDGNAPSATKLKTARTISLSGDVTGSASFDGTANAAITATLPNSGVTAGEYGPIPSMSDDTKSFVLVSTNVNQHSSKSGVLIQPKSGTSISFSFDYEVFSESASYDYLLVEKWSTGSESSATKTQVLKSGGNNAKGSSGTIALTYPQVLHISYVKDSSVSRYDDRAVLFNWKYVANATGTPNTQITTIDQVADLISINNGGWDDNKPFVYGTPSADVTIDEKGRVTAARTVFTTPKATGLGGTFGSFGILRTRSGGTGNKHGLVQRGHVAAAIINDDSTVEGVYNVSCGKYCHSEGSGNIVGGLASHAECSQNIASSYHWILKVNSFTASTKTLVCGMVSGLLPYDNTTRTLKDVIDELSIGDAITCIDTQYVNSSSTFTVKSISAVTSTSTSVTITVNEDFPSASSSGETFNPIYLHLDTAAFNETNETGKRYVYCHVEGRNNISANRCTHVEGYSNLASGLYSHAEGYANSVSATASHVEGYLCVCSAIYSHAEGYNNNVQGAYSHAEGRSNVIKSSTCHAEGHANTIHANSANTHVESYGAHVTGTYNHAEGCSPIISGTFVHIEGNLCAALQSAYFLYKKEYDSSTGTLTFDDAAPGFATAWGRLAAGVKIQRADSISNTARTTYTISTKGDTNTVVLTTTPSSIPDGEIFVIQVDWDSGSANTGTAYCAHVEGFGSVVGANCAHSEGYKGSAVANYSHAEGYQGSAWGVGSHAEGYFSSAKGSYSHAQNYECHATASYTHCGGNNSTASAACAFAHGSSCTASGSYSAVFGSTCTVSGQYSFVAGRSSTCAYNYAGCIGYGLSVGAASQFVCGTYNKTGSAGLFVVGSGTSSTRANAFRITASAVYATVTTMSTGADYAEMFEWKDGNPDKEDRCGRFVTLDGDKIVLAQPYDSFILGIVSGNPSVVGDVYDDQWKNMYMTDVFGRVIWEEVEVPEEVDVIETVVPEIIEVPIDQVPEGAEVVGDTSENEAVPMILEENEMETDSVNDTNWDMVSSDISGNIDAEARSEEVEVVAPAITRVLNQDEAPKTVMVKVDRIERVKTVIQPAHVERRKKINPNYDPNTPYIPRSERPEWEAVGMMGKLVVCDIGNCEVNGFAAVAGDGMACASDVPTPYRVMKRLDDRHVQILILAGGNV